MFANTSLEYVLCIIILRMSQNFLISLKSTDFSELNAMSSEIKQKISETCTALLGLSAVATTAEADPGFPVGEGADPRWGGGNI